MKFRIIPYVVILAILFNCKSNLKAIQSITSIIDPANSASILDKLSPSAIKDSLKGFTSFSIDSLKQRLLNDSVIFLHKNKLDFLKTLEFNKDLDTIFLTNMYIKSPLGGNITSYQYNVLKNDVIYYEIKNLDKNKIQSIELVEGASIRFKHDDIEGKTTIKNKIKILNDNTLTINISNNGFFKNKGFFGSNIKIQLKKLAKPIKYKSEIIKDTVFEKITVKVEKKDTIYKIISNLEFDIAPRLDLTKKHSLKLPITISTDNELLGWGYWIGLKASDSLDITDDQNNVLINFAKHELLKSSEPPALPVSESIDISLIINNRSLDTRSLNYASNYAFYQTDNLVKKSKQKGDILLVNNSNIYSHKIRFLLLYVAKKKYMVSVEKKIFSIEDRIKISLLSNE